MLKIGLLAASRIAERAVVEPAREVEGVEVTAVAARDPMRAKDAARRWGLESWHVSYPELIASSDVDAVYIGTPNSLHRPWAIVAIEAGKHVLCEKPLASNAADAAQVRDADEASAGVVVMEAFHWRYHPMAPQMKDIVDSGDIGEIRRVEARFDIPEGRIDRGNIRWDLSLAGGSTMDLGCYPINWVRFIVGAEPSVAAAADVCTVPGIDASLEVELVWADGVTGSVASSMIAPGAETISQLAVWGDKGVMLATNPIAPQNGAALTVETGSGVTNHPVATSTSYRHQLEAFRDAVVGGAAFPTTTQDGVRNMEVVDACYRAAGLTPRPISE